MVKVQFFTLLRLLIKQREVAVAWQEGETVTSLLNKTQAMIETPFLQKLLEEDCSLKTGTIILINGHNVHHLDKLDSAVDDGDTVALFPPGGGG